MHSIEIKMTQIQLKIRKKPRCSNGLTAPNKCAHMIFFVYFSPVLFLCPSFRGIVCVLDFCVRLQFCWASFFYLKRIILWRVTSKVLRETSLTTNFLPLIFFEFRLVKRSQCQKNQHGWKKSTIELRRWCTVWSVKLEHAIWWILDFFRSKPSRKPHCPWIFRSIFSSSSI